MHNQNTLKFKKHVYIVHCCIVYILQRINLQAWGHMAPATGRDDHSEARREQKKK